MIEKLERLEEKFKSLTEQLCDPAVIADMDKYKQLSKERSDLDAVVALGVQYRDAVKNIEDADAMLEMEEDSSMREFLKEERHQHKEELKVIEKKILMELLPKDPYADRDIMVEIRQGAGGGEAAIFAGQLMRAYMKFAERKGFKTEILDIHETELNGIKEVIFSIKGRGVYPALKFESGVHRVQRVPDTEASGRVHTSTITVAVLPEAEDVDIEINQADLRIDTYRSSSAGGQHVNKTDSAIRITHIPSGVVVACQDERSQRQNREKAMRILRSRLLEQAIRKQEAEIASSRKSQVGSGDRSEKIRTYNFPQSRVTDHRISANFHNIEAIMEGGLDDIVEALQNAEKEEMLQAAGE
ncbi:MAG: peptide chain release factor 1 [Firmicutes bacterium]|nr:peptide chain release factor 1 [Bacillota bacterium]